MNRSAHGLVLALAISPASTSGADSAHLDGGAGRADAVQARTTTLVRDMARQLDAFFSSEEHGTFEENRTRVRLRLNVDQIEHHGFEIKPKVKVHLKLPGASERLRLVINDGDAQDGESPSPEDENDVALRWIARQSKTSAFSVDAGMRIKDGGPDVFGRVNLGFKYPLGEHWHLQTTNRIYHYSTTGWRNDFRQYFNRPLDDHLLFRSRTRVQYFEENDSNPNLEQKFSVFHMLQNTTALAYEALWRRESAEESIFDRDEIVGEPKDHYEQVAVRVRFRRSMWRPWFYVEFWPIVAWPEERDWETVFAARLRLEVNLGSHGELRLDE